VPRGPGRAHGAHGAHECSSSLSAWRQLSTTWQATDDRPVLSGDLVAALTALKAENGSDILLACGPRTLGPLAGTPGLVDEYLIVIHPAVITAGPRMFDDLSTDLALQLVEAKVFDAGAVVLRYTVVKP